MTTNFVELDVDIVKSMFELEKGRIYRISDNARWDGMDVTDQKLLRIGEDRIPNNRIKYVLENGVVPKGEVVKNDYGKLVVVTNNHFRTMLMYRGTGRVMRYKTGYLGRFVDRKGIRRGKRFDTYQEAAEYANFMTKMVWYDDAKEYGFKIA